MKMEYGYIIKKWRRAESGGAVSMSGDELMFDLESAKKRADEWLKSIGDEKAFITLHEVPDQNIVVTGKRHS